MLNSTPQQSTTGSASTRCEPRASWTPLQKRSMTTWLSWRPKSAVLPLLSSRSSMRSASGSRRGWGWRPRKRIGTCRYAVTQSFSGRCSMFRTRPWMSAFAPAHLSSAIPPMRFCAGAPILEPSGYAFGTVCVIDTVPRQLTSSQLSALSALARQAAGHLELRRRTADADRAKRAAQAEAAMRYQLLRAANDAIVLLSADLQVIEASFSLRPCWDIRWTKPFPCTRGTGMQPSIPDQRFSRAERHPRRRAILSRASGRERTVPGWQSRSAIAMLMGQTDKTCSKRQIGGAER